MLIDPAVFLALASFAIVTSITPRPINLKVMASGVTFGWRRSLAPIGRFAGGFGAMISAVLLGASATYSGLAISGLVLASAALIVMA